MPFRILLVEDNAGDADLVREALASSAAQVAVKHVESVAQASEVVSVGGIDIVLLDLSLPDATGLEGVSRLHETAPDIPIVVLTGSEDEALGSSALQAGAQDYLIKGQTEERLLVRAMRYAVERQELHAARSRLLAHEQAARVAAEAEQQRSGFLAEISMLLGESIDPSKLDGQLSQVVEQAVPRFADCCIFMRSGPRSPHQLVAVRHVVPEKEQIVRDLASLDDSCDRRASSRESGSREIAAMGCFNTRLVDSLAVCSAVIARLDSRDASGGTILFLYTAESGRCYEAEDRKMIEDVGRTASLALANAQLYQEVRRAVGLREEFVAIASHELRTPLSTLTLQVTSLKNTIAALPDPKPERLRLQCERMEKQAGRLTQLVSDLLDVAQSTADHLTLDRETCDLGELAREVTDRFNEEAAKARCAIEVQARAPVVGEWDRMRLEQLLTNLLANAIKYGKGALVEVAVSSAPGAGVLSVRDHGIGISEADVLRIFERFERAVSSREFTGLGLGLYISRQIAIAHGGSIVVQSVLGEGATFVVTLPLLPPSSPPGRDEEPR